MVEAHWVLSGNIEAVYLHLLSQQLHSVAAPGWCVRDLIPWAFKLPQLHRGRGSGWGLLELMLMLRAGRQVGQHRLGCKSHVAGCITPDGLLS